ncbi:MAG TPA: hotdog domain-containing protein [Actinomycetes bacterium]
MALDRGARAVVVREVTPEDTARALGSGDLEVLGTPRLLAWCEQATVAAVADGLDEGRTSVGTRVEIAHERASTVGTTVTVTAELTHVDGRLLRFDVVAEQEADGAIAVVGRGTVTRVVVDRERFLRRL